MRLKEQLKISPFFSTSTKQAASKQGLEDFTRYALLGHVIHMPFLNSADDVADKLSSISID